MSPVWSAPLSAARGRTALIGGQKRAWPGAHRRLKRGSASRAEGGVTGGRPASARRSRLRRGAAGVGLMAGRAAIVDVQELKVLLTRTGPGTPCGELMRR